MKTFLEFLTEGLTIPDNGDPNEQTLRKILVKNGDLKYADSVIRWFRNLTDGSYEKTSPDVFATAVLRVLKRYDEYVATLKLAGLETETVELNGKRILVDKLHTVRKYDVFLEGADKLQELAKAYPNNGKYTVKASEMKDIRLLGSTTHVQLWATRGYETTNKFVFNLWQNSETLGRGDVYGDPREQTPYCTHSKQHWDDFALGREKYTQYWFLERPAGAPDAHGDLSDAEVVKAYRLLTGNGFTLLICQNDSIGDLRGRTDDALNGYSNLPQDGEECEELHETYLTGMDVRVWTLRNGFQIGNWDNNLDKKFRVFERKDAEDPGDEKPGPDHPDCCDHDVEVEFMDDLDSLEGMPKAVKGSVVVQEIPQLKSLDGITCRATGSIVLFGLPGVTDVKGIKISAPKLSLYRMANLESLEGLTVENCSEVELYKIPKLKSLAGMSFDAGFAETLTLTLRYLGISDLKGIHVKKADKIFISHCESLTSLENDFDEVGEIQIAYCPGLKTLEHAPYTEYGINMTGVEVSEEEDRAYQEWCKAKCGGSRFKLSDWTPEQVAAHTGPDGRFHYPGNESPERSVRS